MTLQGTLAWEAELVLVDHGYTIAKIAKDTPGWENAVQPGLMVTSLPSNAAEPNQELAVAVVPVSITSTRSEMETALLNLDRDLGMMSWRLYPATMSWRLYPATEERKIPVILGTQVGLLMDAIWQQDALAAATADYWYAVIAQRRRWDESRARIIETTLEYLQQRGMAHEGQRDGGMTYLEVDGYDGREPHMLRFTLDGRRWLSRVSYTRDASSCYVTALHLVWKCPACGEAELESENLHGKDEASVGRILLEAMTSDQRCDECKYKARQEASRKQTQAAIAEYDAVEAAAHDETWRINEQAGKAILRWASPAINEAILGHFTQAALFSDYGDPEDMDLVDLRRHVGYNLVQWLRGYGLTVGLKPGQ